MNFTFVIRPEAKADIDSAFDWYQSKREGLGFEFERCLEAAFSRLLHDPESFAFEFDELRRVPVRRFPFGMPPYSGLTINRYWAIKPIRHSAEKYAV